MLFRSKSLPLLARGKVRDNYAVGNDRILMVASDRISAFDVIMGEPIPGKGELLTRMALYWFDRLGPKGLNICPIHLTGDAPESAVTADEVAQVRGRSMLVKRLKPIPVEAVVRGYLAGSGWQEYQQSRSVCGVPLPAGLNNASRLPQPIFTPAAKAAVGEHDENITFERVVEISFGEFAHAGSRRNLLGDNPDPELVKNLSNELQVNQTTPPTFLWHTMEDKGVPVENSMLYAAALRRAGVPFSLHVYETGAHGLGLGRPERPAPPWGDQLLYWFKERKFTASK